jgi:hypothetical protein
VVKETSLFMLSDCVDPSEVEWCSERAKKAEKEASNAKSEVTKLKDHQRAYARRITGPFGPTN